MPRQKRLHNPKRINLVLSQKTMDKVDEIMRETDAESRTAVIRAAIHKYHEEMRGRDERQRRR
jgi:metal-responsive CopG/Arc/MetJ family transcriptional regulator